VSAFKVISTPDSPEGLIAVDVLGLCTVHGLSAFKVISTPDSPEGIIAVDVLGLCTVHGLS
jgi:multisubunit Na+/H+ antiporter MnhF subunit